LLPFAARVLIYDWIKGEPPPPAPREPTKADQVVQDLLDGKLRLDGKFRVTGVQRAAVVMAQHLARRQVKDAMSRRGITTSKKLRPPAVSAGRDVASGPAEKKSYRQSGW
jgi:hypothetical protein